MTETDEALFPPLPTVINVVCCLFLQKHVSVQRGRHLPKREGGMGGDFFPYQLCRAGGASLVCKLQN